MDGCDHKFALEFKGVKKGVRYVSPSGDMFPIHIRKYKCEKCGMVITDEQDETYHFKYTLDEETGKLYEEEKK